MPEETNHTPPPVAPAAPAPAASAPAASAPAATAPAATAPAAPAPPVREERREGGRPSGGPRGERPQRRGRFGGPRPPKVCPFCAAKVKYIDYKQSDQLRRYLTDRGKIKARRKVGTCAKHQRRLALAIKRARHIALLPFTAAQARGE